VETVRGEVPTAERQDASAAVDGRTARRERGKLAVLEAILAYIAETDGKEKATPELIAERAGGSVASLFRYFGTLDGMRQAAADHWFLKNAHLLTVPKIGQGPLEERIENYVQARLASFAANKAVGRMVRAQAAESGFANDHLMKGRAIRVEQLRRHFGEEFSGLAPDQADQLVSVIATLTSHDSFVQLTERDGMELSDTAGPLRNAMKCLLSASFPS